MIKPLPLKEVERRVRNLLASDRDAPALRAELEVLAKEWRFGQLTWLWGPALYRRDRIRFRPFILAHWGGLWRERLLGREPMSWSGATGAALQDWLDEVDRNDDIELFRLLHAARHTRRGQWTPDNAALLADLRRRLEAAPSPARARIVLEKCDLWGLALTEDAALDLYRRDRLVASRFVLKHLPFTWSGDGKRQIWQRLLDAARQVGDDGFADQLYRKQVPLARWREDALAACRSVRDPTELCALLERRHPTDLWRNLGDAFIDLLEARGRDVLPYVARHLRQVWSPWLIGGSYGRLVTLARGREWWDLWAGVVRTCSRPKDFNAAVRDLVEDRVLPERTVRERLLLLAGVGREWNWGGVGIAQVQQLDDRTAIAFHERFPDLLRGPWKLHLQVSAWGAGLPKLIERVIAQDDVLLIDHLASRIATHADPGWQSAKPVATAEPLADYYARLKQRDEAEFGRRAIAVLGRIPAFAIHRYTHLLRTNRLARLLFERSHGDFLREPVLLSDLVEAPEIHVQALAYRILGLDDPRARTAAAANIDVLIGTLLRPLHRATRLAAFCALANAAHDPDIARRILARAREALDMPELRYPKEPLVGLIGRILHRHAALRAPAEQPIIYRRAAS